MFASCSSSTPPPSFPHADDDLGLFRQKSGTDDIHQQQDGGDNNSLASSSNSSNSPKVLPSHEHLFETIARLAGIEEQKGETENGTVHSADGSPLESDIVQGTLLNNILKPNTIHHHQSSSSSRRKNGNPTRISDGTAEENSGVKEEAEEEGMNWLKSELKQEEEAGEEEDEERGQGREEEKDVDEQTGTEEEEPHQGVVQVGQQLPSLAPPPPFPFSFALGGPAPPSVALLEDQQRRFYAQLIQQGQSSQAQLQQSQMLEMQRNFSRLAQQLKDELSGMFAGAVDKDQQVIGDFSAQEAQAHVGRLLTAFSMAARQHQWAAEQLGMFGLPSPQQQPRGPFFPTTTMTGHGRSAPSSFPSSMPPPTANPFHALLAQNPLMAAMMAASGGHQPTPSSAAVPASSGLHQSASAGGIFPSMVTSNHNGLLAPPSRHFAPSAPHLASESDGSPRKKRAKVTDSVRGPRSALHSRDPLCTNSSTSERSTPQGLPPTMVPLNSQLLFRSPERTTHGRSPSDGDESEQQNGTAMEIQPHRTQLTHVHLRKAKLMFFYQRYPSSAILKSYFPDVQFNKHNTAQLVKWFSNFREFFYMCMEKFAKQALAEGVKHPEELMVTCDSELFKQLNQHYNKNSVFPPPERLQYVVQETLREFFTALQQRKDTEPSWKKTIYKVIQQLDEPIPEHFRDSHFVEMLERS